MRARTALLIAALALVPALPACPGGSGGAPAQPEPVGIATAPPADRPTTAAIKAEPAPVVTAAPSPGQLAAEQRAAAERASAAVQMQREQQAAKAAAAAEQARAEAETRAARVAALETGKNKTPEQLAAQNAAAIALAGPSAPQAGAAAPAPAAPAPAPATAPQTSPTQASPPAASASGPAGKSGLPAAGARAAAAAPIAEQFPQPKATGPAEDYSQLVAEIQTTKGTLVLEFFPGDAPDHVRNFVELARRGFYDRMRFHRIIPGYLVQTGDPSRNGDGTGDPGYRLMAEWNGRHHHRGTLSMARLSHPDSAGSQFFICHDENAGYDLGLLDGRYTAFGQLIRGYDTLDAIAACGSPDGTPLEAVTMLKVIIRPRQPGDREPGAPPAEPQ